MAITSVTTQGEMATYFEKYIRRFTYLMKNADSVRTWQDITTLQNIFEIHYKDGTERTWQFQDIQSLLDLLQETNNNMAPKEAWQFHKRGLIDGPQ